jgi:hypothetical protein
MPRQRDWEYRAGKGFVDRLDEVVIRVGEYTFSRREMIELLKCGNFAAGARLNRAMMQFSGYRTVSELARAVKIGDLMSIKHVGVTTVFVWMCVVEYAKLSPLRWLDSEVSIATTYEHTKKKARKRKKK